MYQRQFGHLPLEVKFKIQQDKSQQNITKKTSKANYEPFFQSIASRYQGLFSDPKIELGTCARNLEQGHQ